MMMTAKTRTENAAPATTPTELAARMRLVVTRLARRLRQQTDPGVSPTGLAALSTIEHSGPLTLGALAKIERVQPPTITAAVGRLEELGLVTRATDSDDRRVTYVQITTAGRRLLAHSRSRKNAYLDRQLRGLSTAEQATLAEASAILERMLEEQP